MQNYVNSYFSSSFELFRVNHLHDHCNDSHPQSQSYYWIVFTIFFHYIVWLIHILFQTHISDWNCRFFPSCLPLKCVFARRQHNKYEHVRAWMNEWMNEWMNDCKKRSRYFPSIIHVFYSRISFDFTWFSYRWTNEWIALFHQWYSVPFSCIFFKDRLVICIK